MINGSKNVFCLLFEGCGGKSCFRTEAYPAEIRQLLQTAEKYAVEQGNSIHEAEGEIRRIKLQRGNDVAQEINRTDIVAEGEQISSFFPADVPGVIQFTDDACAHGKTAQKAHQNDIRAVRTGSKEPMADRMQNQGELLRQIQTDHDAG